MKRAHTEPIALIGREPESRAVTERVDAAKAGGGGALVIRGAPGIGKTTLLTAARAHAAATSFEVLKTTGVQSETHLPFAGLHQLLRPLLHDVDRLPATYAKALHSAFGLSEESVSSPYLVAMAVLQLLGESAERAPLLLLVDDAQWLDGSTAGALAFIARRLESDPMVLIVALRDGFESPLLEAGIPELHLDALTNAHAEALMDARSPDLDRELRTRVLGDAAGNPLALVELSVALRAAADKDRVLVGSDLPLTARLERAFADRLGSLPQDSRSFLRVAAADGRGLLSELLSATSTLEGHEITLAAVSAAEAAGLIEVEGVELRFRHPLMRSAIYQAMSLVERRETHAALATMLAGDPDRQTWHRAAATVGADRQVAADLAAIAERASARGAAGVAIQAVEHAARFADSPEMRGIHLARATSLALVMGRASTVLRFLDSMDDAHVPVVERPFVATMRESYGRSPWSGASRIPEFVAIAERMRVEGKVARGMTALFVIANRCWWSNPDEAARTSVIDALRRFPVPEDDQRAICILAMASPVEHGAIVLDHLARHAAGPGPESSPQLGLAAHAVGDFVSAERLMEARARFLRAQGLLGGLTSCLLKLAWVKLHRGDWNAARSMASEAERLGEETGQQDLAAGAALASATIAAYRGEGDGVDRLIVEGERTLLPSGANPQRAMAQWARGAVALASGQFEEAYQHLRPIFDASEGAFHPHIRSWVLVDLVEAALHSGHEDEAARFVGELAPDLARSRSPLLDGALHFARAALGSDDHDAVDKLASWPFMRARLQLEQGVRLRRHRRPADARVPLRAARDAFDALGAAPWGERARQELRASGETSRRRNYELIDALSPQERQIAQLAAEGLSNKEIGQQLFVSHRTISTHLYRIFPKLGITTRSHLRAALETQTSR